jgi:hypothetical protein
MYPRARHAQRTVAMLKKEGGIFGLIQAKQQKTLPFFQTRLLFMSW